MRTADGALKKEKRKQTKKEEEENRMLIPLNLLVNCHLRNASFCYFFYLAFLD